MRLYPELSVEQLEAMYTTMIVALMMRAEDVVGDGLTEVYELTSLWLAEAEQRAALTTLLRRQCVLAQTEGKAN